MCPMKVEHMRSPMRPNGPKNGQPADTVAYSYGYTLSLQSSREFSLVRIILTPVGKK